MLIFFLVGNNFIPISLLETVLRLLSQKQNSMVCEEAMTRLRILDDVELYVTVTLKIYHIYDVLERIFKEQLINSKVAVKKNIGSIYLYVERFQNII